MFTLTRSRHNPILSPLKDHPWEAAAAFNGCPIVHNKKTHLLYRAMSEPDLLSESHMRTSVIAKAVSKDNINYEDRKILISPDREFDFRGCEDPRVTKLNGKFYIFYTALGGYPYSADNIKVAVAISKDLETITEKHLVTPFNAKAMALFPDKINGKMAALLTVNTDRKPSDICYVEFDKEEDMWSDTFWESWWENLDAHKINIRRFDTDQVELGAPPVKTDKGWIVVYSHIQKYGQAGTVFGIEVILLDLKDPRKIIGRTKGPFMAPDEYYEKMGMVSNVIFPSGALIRNDHLEIYYGAADTHCAFATIPLDNLLLSITEQKEVYIKRYPGNPIISPRPGVLWESEGTINPASVYLKDRFHILYRAVASGNVSTLGYATSFDGLSIDERSDNPVYFPRASFETNANSSSNFGCEDPRLIEIDNRLYMTYTAYDGVTPRVAVSSISVKDFLLRRWSAWSNPEVITPPSISNKDAVIFPEKINGGYMVIHRVNESICADLVPSLDFSKDKITQCIEIISPRRGMWDGGKVGISTPPVKTKNGWLLLYHGVSTSTTYRVGAVLLDLVDPTIVRARTAIPLFEPEEEYERKGIVPNVVFPCGFTIRGTTAFMYYGGGDFVIGVATMKVSTLLRMLEI